jgi:hypothetical protein
MQPLTWSVQAGMQKLKPENRVLPAGLHGISPTGRTHGLFTYWHVPRHVQALYGGTYDREQDQDQRSKHGSWLHIHVDQVAGRWLASRTYSSENLLQLHSYSILQISTADYISPLACIYWLVLVGPTASADTNHYPSQRSVGSTLGY